MKSRKRILEFLFQRLIIIQICTVGNAVIMEEFRKTQAEIENQKGYIKQ